MLIIYLFIYLGTIVPWTWVAVCLYQQGGCLSLLHTLIWMDGCLAVSKVHLIIPFFRSGALKDTQLPNISVTVSFPLNIGLQSGDGVTQPSNVFVTSVL